MRPTRRNPTVALALLGVFVLAAAVLVGMPHRTRAADTVTPLTAIAASADTGEKPQSKVWTYNGQWWAVMPKSSAPAGTWLWRLEPGNTWTSVLQLSASTSAHADVKPVGNVAHVLLYGGSTELVSVEFVAGAYQLWAIRPTTTSVTLSSGHETATIDIDSTGRMWLATETTSTVETRYSDAPYSSFSGPITLATGINSDDISVVQALPNGTVGVLWSNQNTQRFGFRLHVDGADPNTWSADEVPASASALNVGLGMSDDHMNTKVAADGTLYAAVKTSYDTAGFPKIAMLIRRPGGTWDPLYEVDQAGTRGIILLNESAGTVRIVYTSSEGFNNIVYKESPISSIAFGPQQTLITGGVNNATSTKQNWTNEVVILASNGSNSAPGVRITTDSPTSTPTATVTLGTTPSATSTPTVNATPSATNTPPADPCGTNGLVAVWGMEEASGATLLDGSVPPAHDATMLGNATRVPATVVGSQALSLDGTGDYATTPNEACLNITGAITLAAWVKPGRATTTDLIKKAVNGSTNGYELSLSQAGAAADQKVFFRVNQVATTDTFRVNSTTMYPSSGTTWIHVAATYDGATMRIYVNGTLEGSVAGPASIAANTNMLSIGGQSDGTRTLLGQMDDARVYNRALTACEIGVLAGVTCGTATPTVTPGPSATQTQTPTTGPSTPTPTASATATGDPVLVGAGDISSCSVTTDEATALLLDAIPGTVFTLGDNVYEDGTATEFSTCYDPTWGRHKTRTRPVAGNHDYNTDDATGYYDYFNGVGPIHGSAGDRDKGYYSYDIGSFWHVVVLNSECLAVPDGIGTTACDRRLGAGDVAAPRPRRERGQEHHLDVAQATL